MQRRLSMRRLSILEPIQESNLTDELTEGPRAAPIKPIESRRVSVEYSVNIPVNERPPVRKKVINIENIQRKSIQVHNSPESFGGLHVSSPQYPQPDRRESHKRSHQSLEGMVPAPKKSNFSLQPCSSSVTNLPSYARPTAASQAKISARKPTTGGHRQKR